MIKNFAHRGFSGKYPENTILALQKAIEIGSDGIELDVQLTKDGEVVIIHDETIDRTSDGTGFVCDYTYEELIKYDFSGSYIGKVEKQKLPLLKDYFEMVKDINIISNIELKNSIIDYKDIERKVYDLIIEYGLKDKVIISSFNHESIIRMKKIDESIVCGFLVDYIMLDAPTYTKKYNVECFHPSGYGLTKEKVESLKNQGIEVNVWLGSHYIDYKELIDMGIDALISDNPDQVKEIISNL